MKVSFVASFCDVYQKSPDKPFYLSFVTTSGVPFKCVNKVMPSNLEKAKFVEYDFDLNLRLYDGRSFWDCTLIGPTKH